ncbi:MAG: NADH-quinone oxidoreductase subunit N [Sandaracinaceae bacterium]
MTTAELMWLGPLLLVAAGGLIMMLVDAFTKEGAELSLVSAVILAGGAAVSFALWAGGPALPADSIVTQYLTTDPQTHFLDLVIGGGGALAALLAGGYLREHRIERGEFYVILVFSALGAMALARAVDLLSLFIALETMSLGIYGLVAFRRSSPNAAEGAIKYFLLGSFASAILLFGIALLYGATGHTNLEAIRDAVSGGHAQIRLLTMSLLFLLVGLAFKVSAVPFHAWAPDAYQGAVTPATTYMAVVVKAAVFGVMIRVLFVAFGDDMLANANTGWPPAIAGLAAVTMVFGNLAALVQKNVKRMLAYSSISHAGFVLMGIAAGWKLDGGSGLAAVLFYLAAYTVSNVLSFGALILVGSHGKEAVTYEDLAGVGRRHPWVGVPFALGVLSLMGFPPLAGFFGKYYVILASAEAGGGMIWLAVIAVLSSAMGAYYYLRVLVFMFMKKPEAGAPVAVPMRSGHVIAALVIAGYFVVRLGVSPGDYLALVSAGEGDHIDLWPFLWDAGFAVLGGSIAAVLSTWRPGARETSVEPASR